MQSKYAGKCKDCESEHAIGDEIDRNNNDNWCRNGRNCQGAMQLQGTVTPQTKISLEDIIEEAQIVTCAFVGCVRGLGIENPDGVSTVWNTVIMRRK